MRASGLIRYKGLGSLFAFFPNRSPPHCIVFIFMFYIISQPYREYHIFYIIYKDIIGIQDKVFAALTTQAGTERVF